MPDAVQHEGPIVDLAMFESAFTEHFAAVHRFIARRVGISLADDLAAEVFATAFRRRATFDPNRGSARSWFYGIATNFLRNHWRTEDHLLKIEARLRVEGTRGDRVTHSDEQLSAAEIAPVLATALLSLSEAQREIILLHAWAELSNDEIASALGIAPGTVRSRLSRARAKLVEQLGAFDFDLWLFDKTGQSPTTKRTDDD